MLRAPERAAYTAMPESCWKSRLPTATIHGEERNSECCCCRPIWDVADGPGIVDFLLEPHVHSSAEMYKRGGESVWPVVWPGDPHARMPFPALGWGHLLGVSGSPSVNQRCL